MFEHPEKQEGEICLTNSTKEDFIRIGWKTKRMGIVPYDIHGRALRCRLYPVFVQASELKEKGVTPTDLYA